MIFPNMFWIEIKSLMEAQNFTDWMREHGKAVTCMDSIEFTEWLKKHKTYPFSIYMDGMTYEFRSEQEMLLFLVGFEAAMGLRI